MKKWYYLLIIVALGSSVTSFGQSTMAHATFHGAEASLASYKALYILDQSDEKKMKMIIRNINNAMDDPRLKGKLEVELVAFGDGVEMFKKTNGMDTLLTKLQNRGVLLAQCENTIRERKISKDELWPFISYVPSGNGEIIIRQYQGWAIVQP